MRTLYASLALAFGLLVAGASPAQAAKGVKKKTAGSHYTHGVVTHVHHHKVKNANGHTGELTVKTHHHKKKGQPAVAGKKLTGHTHKFSFSHSTRFTAGHGKSKRAVSSSAVHKGSHVAVSHTGHHADAVAVHTHHKKATGVKPKAKKAIKKAK